MADWVARAVDAARAALEPLADPVRAAPMAAYMRDQFPFLGIPAPLRRSALRAGWRELGPPAVTADLADAASALWSQPAREYQYAACDLLARHSRTAEPQLLAAVEGLVVTRSWWDSVDALRPAAVGPLVAAHPELFATTDRWIESDDRWLARSALIHQLGYGRHTDAERLFRYCHGRAADPEFFVAKAIGWALRTYARVDVADDGAVRTFVAQHPQLTSVARREALRRS